MTVVHTSVPDDRQGAAYSERPGWQRSRAAALPVNWLHGPEVGTQLA